MQSARIPALLAALLVAACSDPPPPAHEETEIPRTFVGTATCGSCHAPELAAWQDSHHALAMQEAAEATVLGDFADAEFDYFGETTRFFRRDGSFFVHTADAGGEPRDFPVAFTFGVMPLQQYLVEFPGGRLQALPFAWDARPAEDGGQRWFHLHADEHVAADDPLYWTGPNQNWNYMCAECHSTDVKLGYDAPTDTFQTTYAEISVGCEACHGPGSRHVAQAQGGAFNASHGLALDLSDPGIAGWIMNPTTGIAALPGAATEPPRQPEACGRCHSRRATIAADYEYGRPLAETHLPALLEEHLYFPDGQIQDEVYVYGSFRQSRMYRAGVTCTSCHEPHSGRLKTGPEPSAMCAQCHLPDKFATTEHAGHDPAAAACVDCHMPERTYMSVDPRRDHSFRTPRPDLGVATGAPNACTTCHADRDAAWAASVLRQQFASDAAERPHFATVLAAGRAGAANAELAAAASNRAFPDIARATALSLLRPPGTTAAGETVQEGLHDPDPLVRIAALRSLPVLPAASRLEAGTLLGDPVHGVRIEAALALAGFRDLLPVADARNFARAADEYREAFELTANRAESRSALGAFELASGNLAAAAHHYEDALRLDPGFLPARLNYADVLRQRGEDERAGAVLREGIERHPDDAALRHALGLYLVRAGEPAAALASLERAVEIDPSSSRYVYVLAVARHSLGEADEALALLERASERFEADYDIGWALATMRRDAGDVPGARQAADELARHYPDDPNVTALRQSLAPPR